MEGGFEASDIYDLYEVSYYRNLIEAVQAYNEILADSLNRFYGGKGSHAEATNF